ncbi:unc-32 [Pristionchus pacificus]|uniref:V-type proton ATPase subunit a n=1 Tax=Pristionchus pacificus TaxID=54126 RepID=A0A2A6BAT2_PRIPA|nr:unc-32 [Pristionchus pacificus]|eukprot:PDM62992.1 unc-32 [Pristionchus pacificus]
MSSSPDDTTPGIFRSEEVCLSQLFLQSEAAYTSVAELGELGLVQFRDLNPDTSSFQRKFVSEVRRCDEMERKLRFLEREIKKDQIPMLDTGENPDAPQPREMIDLEATFEKLENELREVNQNEETLKKNFSELTELKHILRKTQTFFEEIHRRDGPGSVRASASTSATDREPLIHVDDEAHAPGELFRQIFGYDRRTTNEHRQSGGGDSMQGGGGPDDVIVADPAAESETMELTGPAAGHGHAGMFANFGFVAGVIQRERIPAFERLLWRACRGNVFLRHSEIDDVLNDTATGEPINKSVFIIFFQGDQLKTKVKKICEGFRATLYPCPDTPSERREMSIGVMTRIEDLKTVLGQTQDHRHRVLVAAAKNVRMWLTKVRKIKSIYHTLNLFNIDVTQKCLIAECWCPVDALDRIRMALKRGTYNKLEEESGSTVPSILNRMDTTEAPPTYNKSNKYTVGFQNIVDAYGIATYREINPAIYTMISFPFLFAVMFGDMGHGTIMLLAALFLILREKQLEAARIRDEIFQMFFGGRYVIFLMGAFSIYTGFLYNDIFSKSLNIFGSAWANSLLPNETQPFFDKGLLEVPLMLVPEKAYVTSPYPIGVDPVWNLAEANKLSFLNSMKMKSSVILGIGQMTFGLILSYHNYKYFHSDLDVKFMFIPQMLFMACIFIYLCLQIIVKWLAYSATAGVVFGYEYPGSNCAPSLLIGLINMFMMKSRDAGFVGADGKVSWGCSNNLWYPGQSFFETVFVLIALACIPVMLFAKPYFMWKAEKERQAGNGHMQLGTAETVLVIVAVVQIPIMLFVKPFFVWRRDKAAAATRESVRADMNGGDSEAEVVHHEPKTNGGGGHGHGDGPLLKDGDGTEAKKLDMADVMVYQAIHTIEFALGCISHTASYLRLWALSLAHAQLSDVLWTMVFRAAFRSDGYIGAISTYLLFFAFFFLSVFILVLMEGLSAFLHALRLHWVEFQSKFYGGHGYVFAPFSFEKILEAEREAEEA